MPKAPFIPHDLPPPGIVPQDFLSLLSKAHRGLGQFEGILTGILNPAVLLAPITNREAMLSSQIEGTVATVAEVLEHEAGEMYDEAKRGDIKEIVNYRQALLMGEAYVQERPISLAMIRELHATLTEGVRGGDKTPGQFRTEQNWIGPRGCTLNTARFIPPAPLIMGEHLDRLQAFISSDYEDPLIQLAVIHAQFEIIHPFNDGNGRLGRMLMPLFLYQRGLLPRPAFYLSEYLERNDMAYRDALLNITELGDWSGWISFFLEGLIWQAEANIEKAKALLELYHELKQKFVSATHSQFAGAALDAFFQRPILNSTAFKALVGVDHRTTSNNLLKGLLADGQITLARAQSGRTPAIYALKRLIDICDGRLPNP